MTRVDELDLGICRALVFPASGPGWAVLLPGAGYGVQAPLLWFGRMALSGAGLNVIAVNDRYTGDEQARAWVERRLLAALDRVDDPRPLILAKSISTLAAPMAAERQLPAVWLTPLLQLAASPVVAGLRARAAPALLVGGTADSAWDGELARSFEGVDVVEIAGADHSLQLDGDTQGSLDVLASVVEAIERFAEKQRAS